MYHGAGKSMEELLVGCGLPVRQSGVRGHSRAPQWGVCSSELEGLSGNASREKVEDEESCQRCFVCCESSSETFNDFLVNRLKWVI